MFACRLFLAVATACLLLGFSNAQPPETQPKDDPPIEIPPKGWKLDRLKELNLKPIRATIFKEGATLLVEFTKDVSDVGVVDLGRRLNQNPGIVEPYFITFRNGEKKIWSVPLGFVRDQVGGRKGDRFEIPFAFPPGLAFFRPVEVEFRGPNLATGTNAFGTGGGGDDIPD